MPTISKVLLRVLFIGAILILPVAIFTAHVLLESNIHFGSRTDMAVFLIEKTLPKPFLHFTKKLINKYHKIVVWNDDIRQRSVWGYVDFHSIQGGESFHLMLATDPIDKIVRGHIEIFRIGYYGKSDRIKVWESGLVTVQERKLYDSGGVIGPGWPSSLNNIPTTMWQSGYYTFDFVDLADRRDADIAYIVVTPTDLDGDILVKLNTNTYQAYNTWGGANFYESLFTGAITNMVSFNRPTRSEFFRWEYYYVLWLEHLASELGLIVHYATDFDVHEDSKFTTKYPLLISVGHDEYWSKEEFTHMYDRIFVHGKNTLFLGANVAYKQIRFVDVDSTESISFEGRQMIFYSDNVDPITFKRGQDPVLDQATLFAKDYRRSGIMLTGVSFQSGFQYDGNLSYPYYVALDPDAHPLFAETGYTLGSPIGNLVGHEWDNTDPSSKRNRYWNADVSQIPFLPKDKLTILFAGEAIDYKGKKGKAEAVYFESDVGSKVFSSGTIQWSWGLTKEGFRQDAFNQFNRNLIEHFLGDTKKI